LVIGVLTVTLSIPDANSLKDKRKVIKGLKDKLRNKFNISVSEIGDQDIWRTAIIAIAIVSEDSAFANSVLSKAQDYVEYNSGAIMTNCELEWR
jgi:uncharacterized protein YlxP (DUF503 family)